jgi:hypothetical protein
MNFAKVISADWQAQLSNVNSGVASIEAMRQLRRA